jgi:hypothetical protein
MARVIFLLTDEKIFRNQPIRNKSSLWRPCLLTDRDKMSILYRGPSIDASYQVSVHLAKWYGSWIYNYLCNQCLSPLMLWVWISFRARCTTLCDKVCQWLATGRWFFPDPPFFSTYKTEILLAHLAKGNVSFCHHVASVSSVNFPHCNLLLWNPSAKWTETW